MALLRVALFLSAFAVATADPSGDLDEHLVLSADDECQADDAADAFGCALNAIQLRADVSDVDFDSEGDILATINKALAGKLSKLNGGLSGMMKSKHADPMDMSKMKGNGKLKFQKMVGLSTMHINSMKATKFNAPKNNVSSIVISMNAKWNSNLVINGQMKRRRRDMPVTVFLKSVTFNTKHIIAFVDMKSKKITKFTVSGVAVKIGSASGTAQARFFRRMINRILNKKIGQKKGAIAAKMGPKLQQVLAKALNAKCPMALGKTR